MSSETHWDHVYERKPETGVSWFEAEPTLSLNWIAAALPAGGRVIDVGGGASVLVDRLLAKGYQVTVLDVSSAALERSKARLGADRARVRWVVGDVTLVDDLGEFDLWHDRAAFHFLVKPQDREAYADLARRSLAPGAYLLAATFAPDGPSRCSDLDVCQYDGGGLGKELGPAFELVREVRHTHTTPWGKPQNFTYALFRRTTTRT